MSGACSPRAGAPSPLSRKPGGARPRRRDPGEWGGPRRGVGGRWPGGPRAGPAPPALAGGGATSPASLCRLPPSLPRPPARRSGPGCATSLPAEAALRPTAPLPRGARRRPRKTAAEAEPARRPRPSASPEPVTPRPQAPDPGPEPRRPAASPAVVWGAPVSTQVPAPERQRGYLAAPPNPARDRRRRQRGSATAARHRA